MEAKEGSEGSEGTEGGKRKEVKVPKEGR
jgi:hypothetical protein